MRLFDQHQCGSLMGPALELISGLVTAPGATLTPLTMASGNSATVRNTSSTALIAMLNTWAMTSAAGIWVIKSPKLHDNVQGIRNTIRSADVSQKWVNGLWQKLYPQDNLTLLLSGSAVGGHIEQAQALIYYNNLDGVNARFINPSTLLSRTVNVWTTEIAITPGSAGGWSGQVAINSLFDNFKANTDYALVGYTVDVICAAVQFLGPDFGNLGLGGPGLAADQRVTERWFFDLSQTLNIPLIPVFNSANKNGTLVAIAQDQGGAAVNVTAYLHELSMPNGAAAQPTLT
jgi:hypothetical protein